jgi:hypothetical protein
LNALAPENIVDMVVTLETSQLDIDVLKDALLWNKPDMSVMADTSHVFMSSGVHTPTGEDVKQVFTAATRSAFVVYTGTAYDKHTFNTIHHTQANRDINILSHQFIYASQKKKIFTATISYQFRKYSQVTSLSCSEQQNIFLV